MHCRFRLYTRLSLNTLCAVQRQDVVLAASDTVVHTHCVAITELWVNVDENTRLGSYVCVSVHNLPVVRTPGHRRSNSSPMVGLARVRSPNVASKQMQSFAGILMAHVNSGRVRELERDRESGPSSSPSPPPEIVIGKHQDAPQ